MGRSARGQHYTGVLAVIRPIDNRCFLLCRKVSEQHWFAERRLTEEWRYACISGGLIHDVAEELILCILLLATCLSCLSAIRYGLLNTEEHLSSGSSPLLCGRRLLSYTALRHHMWFQHSRVSLKRCGSDGRAGGSYHLKTYPSST